VELCNGDFEQIPTFTDPEFEPDLALGVVDAHTAEIESVEEIKANIRQGLRVVPPEKLDLARLRAEAAPARSRTGRPRTWSPRPARSKPRSIPADRRREPARRLNRRC